MTSGMMDCVLGEVCLTFMLKYERVSLHAFADSTRPSNNLTHLDLNDTSVQMEIVGVLHLVTEPQSYARVHRFDARSPLFKSNG